MGVEGDSTGEWWFNAKNQLIKQILDKYAQNGMKIVDVGCDKGKLLQTLRNQYAVSGIEPSEKAVKIGRSRGLEIEVGKAENFATNYPFDIVILSDVLEHIENDKIALKNCVKNLKPGGLAIITVPAFMWMWSKHDESVGHVRRYAANEIADLMKKNGLKIELLSYWNTLLSPAVFVFQKINSSAANKNRSEVANIANKLFGQSLSSILALENWLIRKGISLPIGVSIVAVGRRIS